MKKYIFGVDITDDKNNETIDGRVFVTSEITAEQKKELDAAENAEQELEKKAELPLAFRAMEKVFGFIVLFFVFGVILLRDEISFTEIYQNAPFIFYIILICFVIWLILIISDIAHARKVYSSDAADFTDSWDELEEKLFEQLDIPENALEVDVFVFQYKLKNDKAKFVKAGCFNFLNKVTTAFVQNGGLCFNDVTMRMDIPLDGITGIKRINKRVCFPFWNKDGSYRKEPYKQYRISSNDYGYSVKYFYALCIRHFGIDYELLFPPYELPVIEALIGRTYCD